MTKNKNSIFGFIFGSKIDQSITINRTDEDIEMIEKAKQHDRKIAEKLEQIYRSASRIVNRGDSFFYLTEDEEQSLEKYLHSLYNLKEFITEDNAKLEIYHNNVMAILLCFKHKEMISYFENLSAVFKEKEKFKYMYATALFFEKDYENSLKEYEKLKLDYGDKYLLDVICCLYQLDRFLIIKTLTKSLNIKNYDEFGYIAMYEILSKNKVKKLSENEIQKMSSKFNKFPIFHSLAARMLADLKISNSGKIKSHVQKALRLIDEKELNYYVVNTVYVQIKNIGADKYLINFLKAHYTDSLFVVQLLLDLYPTIPEISDTEFQFIYELTEYAKEKGIEGINYEKLISIMALKAGKKIEALKSYLKTYQLKHEVDVALECLKLSVETGEEIDINIFKENIANSGDSYKLMVSSQFYKELGDNEYAQTLAILAMLKNKDNKIDDELLKGFAGVFLKNEKDEMLSDDNRNTCISIKKSSGEVKNIIISDLIKNKNTHFDAEIISFNGVEAIEFIGKDVDDIVNYDDGEYIIIERSSIHGYFLKLFFKYLDRVKTNNPDLIQCHIGEKEDSLKEVREVLIKIRDDNLKRFTAYDIEIEDDNPIGTVPLSFLADGDNGYFQVIATLLYDKDYKFYAGDLVKFIIEEAEFILDISSLIFMGIINKLDLLRNYKDKIYVTKSTFNMVKRMLKKANEEKISSMRIMVDEEGQLRKHVLTREEKKANITFYREIIKLIQDCNIVEYEGKEILNGLDKVQCDSMQLASLKNYVYICDDLCIRRLFHSVYANGKSSNSTLFLDSLLEKDIIDYFDCVGELAKGKYLQCLNFDSVEKILQLDFNNRLNDDNYIKIAEIIDDLFQTRFLYYSNIGIFKSIIDEEIKRKYSSCNVYMIIVFKMLKYNYFYRKDSD